MDTTRRTFLTLATAAPLMPSMPGTGIPRTMLIAEVDSAVRHIMANLVKRAFRARSIEAESEEEAMAALSLAQEPFSLVFWGFNEPPDHANAPRIVWSPEEWHRPGVDLVRPFTTTNFLALSGERAGWTRIEGA